MFKTEQRSTSDVLSNDQHLTCWATINIWRVQQRSHKSQINFENSYCNCMRIIFLVRRKEEFLLDANTWGSHIRSVYRRCIGAQCLDRLTLQRTFLVLITSIRVRCRLSHCTGTTGPSHPLYKAASVPSRWGLVSINKTIILRNNITHHHLHHLHVYVTERSVQERYASATWMKIV